MARTHIKAVAQEKAGTGTAAYQEIDSSNINNSGLEQVDYNVNTASNVMDPPVHEKRYWHIIKGHGVGGEHISEYPDIDPNSGYSQFGAEVSAAGHKLGNLSVIFDYLNAAGSSIKYTKLEYTKVFSGEDDRFVNLFNRHLSEENYYYSPIKYTMEIYWGDYIKYSSDQGNLPPEQFNIQSIKDLSGEKNILLKDFNQNPGAYVVGSDTMNQGWLKINLDTKKIISLPSLLTTSIITSDAVHTWTIETDDFATTVTTPTPQETTKEVSGTKISQLSSITTVQDSDLFVISRDDVSQGEGDISYDNSYNLEYKTISDTISSQITSQIPPSPLYKVAFIDPAGNFLKNGDSDGNYAFASCSRSGGGQYTFTFGESVSNKNDYVVNVTRLMSTPLEGDVVVVESTRSTTGFSVFSSNDNSTPADPQGLYVVVFLLT